MNPHLRTLQRALETLGTRDELCKALWVSTAELDGYLAGDKPLPWEMYVMALDIVGRGDS
jgi:hypothetical protein